MPAVIHMGEQLFLEDFYVEVESPQQNVLLSTIRVPKNLLYLTDRLPKASYEHGRTRSTNNMPEERKQRKENQLHKDGTNSLPSILNN